MLGAYHQDSETTAKKLSSYSDDIILLVSGLCVYFVLYCNRLVWTLLGFAC